MVAIDCDSPSVTKAIAKLVESLGRHGARLNDRLTIFCRDNELSLRMRDARASEQVVIGLPAECLLPVEEFRLSLSGDAIEITDHSPAALPARREILARVVEVLNLVHKVAQHRYSTPASLRRALPEVYATLCSGRLRPADQPPIRPSPNDPAIDDLLDTRTLVYRLDPASDRHSLVMMPLIDYCNHHPFAPPYSPAVDPAGRRMLTIREFCPDPRTRETFVRYGIYDSYDCFLHYGFVEREAPFVVSIPLDIALPSLGTLTVRARPVHAPRTQLPKEIADLWFYLPAFAVDRESKSAQVSHLMIPQQNAPRALRRVLALILRQIEQTLTEQALVPLIETIEQQILSANVEFYGNLGRYLRDTPLPQEFGPLVRTAEAMVDLQLEKLQRYSFFSPH